LYQALTGYTQDLSGLQGWMSNLMAGGASPAGDNRWLGANALNSLVGMIRGGSMPDKVQALFGSDAADSPMEQASTLINMLVSAGTLGMSPTLARNFEGMLRKKLINYQDMIGNEQNVGTEFYDYLNNSGFFERFGL
jgi:hypothetical protein